MLLECVRCGAGRCGSRFELVLELELGRLTAASSDMMTQLVGLRYFTTGAQEEVGCSRTMLLTFCFISSFSWGGGVREYIFSGFIESKDRAL